jgi:hypothetical protein
MKEAKLIRVEKVVNWRRRDNEETLNIFLTWICLAAVVMMFLDTFEWRVAVFVSGCTGAVIHGFCGKREVSYIGRKVE